MHVKLGTYVAVLAKSSAELFDDFEFTTEKGILGKVDFVIVHAQEFEVDTGNSFDEAFEGGV